MTARRGMTLIEIMISMAILVVVVAMAMTLMLQGTYVSRRGQELADANDAARFAGDALVAALQNAGLGMGNGLLVLSKGTALSSNAVMVINRVNGPDELWVVRPHRKALLESCIDEGAGTTVQKTGFGTIFARCAIIGWNNAAATSLSGSGGDLLLAVTNMKQAALLTKPKFEVSGLGVNLTFDESATGGFADDTTVGFRQGDLVLPVRIEHYYIGTTASGSKALMVEPGTVGAAAYPSPTGNPRVVEDDIEDLQLAVGIDSTSSGNPDNIVWSYGLGVAFQPGVRSVRVSVVARSPKTILMTDGRVQMSADYAPLSVEDHLIGAPIPDGHRRTLFSRRVELVNLGAGDL